MRTILIAVFVVLVLRSYAVAQQPVRITTTTNPDGSVIVTKEFAPPPQQTITIYNEVPVYRTVTTYRQVSVPVAVPLYVVPLSAKVPVAEYRTGLFGLRRNVVHADGTVTRYGPLGRPR